MRSYLSLIFLFLLCVGISGQTATDGKYRAFDGKGKPVTIADIVKASSGYDVVFLGEEHDDLIGHALQLEIFKKIVETQGAKQNIVLSLEMFERDVQVIFKEYLSGQITEAQFLASSRPWGNYKVDYRPLVELAKERKLEVIAANAPRRYVNMVSRLGRDSLLGLTKEAKTWLPPLPYADPSPVYSNKFNALMNGSAEATSAPNPILYSQALWDATMAYSISQTLKKDKKSLVVHLNGYFHTESRLGTVEQLFKYKPDAKVMVVTMRYVDDVNKFDEATNRDTGDFVILTDAKQPRSFK